MADAPQVHLNDIGTSFRCTVEDDSGVVDISTASTLQLIFRKPSGTIITRTAVLVSGGVDGIMEYVTVSGDIDETGFWQYQGRVVIGSNSWKTDIKNEQVYANLN